MIFKMLLLLQVLSKNLPLIYLTYICIHKKGSFFILFYMILCSYISRAKHISICISVRIKYSYTSFVGFFSRVVKCRSSLLEKHREENGNGETQEREEKRKRERRTRNNVAFVRGRNSGYIKRPTMTR